MATPIARWSHIASVEDLRYNRPLLVQTAIKKPSTHTHTTEGFSNFPAALLTLRLCIGDVVTSSGFRFLSPQNITLHTHFGKESELRQERASRRGYLNNPTEQVNGLAQGYEPKNLTLSPGTSGGIPTAPLARPLKGRWLRLQKSPPRSLRISAAVEFVSSPWFLIDPQKSLRLYIYEIGSRISEHVCVHCLYKKPNIAIAPYIAPEPLWLGSPIPVADLCPIEREREKKNILIDPTVFETSGRLGKETGSGTEKRQTEEPEGERTKTTGLLLQSQGRPSNFIFWFFDPFQKKKSLVVVLFFAFR